MSRWIRVFTLWVWLVFAVAGAHSGEQTTLVQGAFEALRESSTALDQGDFDKAKKLLADLKSSAEMLGDTADFFAKQAGKDADQYQIETLAVTAQITETYQAQQIAGSEIAALEGKIADFSEQLQKSNTTRLELEAEANEYRREVKMRQECKNHFWDGLFWKGECWRLGWADLTQNRWISINHGITDNNTQRINIEKSRIILQEQLTAPKNDLNKTRVRKEQLDSQLQGLELKVKTLRATVVSLSNGSVFWRDTVTLIGSNAFSIESLQQNVQLLARRADQSAPAPVFDNYDKEQIRSLEATMVDFAKTLDSRTSILLQ